MLPLRFGAFVWGALLVLLAVALGGAVSQSLWVSSGLLVLGIVLVAAALVRLTERGNRDIARLLAALETDDFAVRFPDDDPSPAVRRLVRVLNRVAVRFRRARQEREEARIFLETILENAPQALIVTDAPTGKVVYINRVARMLPGIGSPEYIVNPSVLQTPERTLRKVRFVAQGRELLLLSLQEIRTELEAREQQAWHALLRVLTHEIMNSLTPVTSLAATASLMAEPGTDLARSLEIIHKRSAGLLQFVQSYRDLTREIRPRFAPLAVQSAVADALDLLHLPSSVAVEWRCPPSLAPALADGQLLAQALINVLKNAAEALPTEGGRIEIELRLLLQQVQIQISDNGCGVDPAHLGQIFIPFFTTKPGGSGVGLSLSRQLLRAMRGDLSLISQPGTGTTVTLTLERADLGESAT